MRISKPFRVEVYIVMKKTMAFILFMAISLIPTWLTIALWMFLAPSDFWQRIVFIGLIVIIGLPVQVFFVVVSFSLWITRGIKPIDDLSQVSPLVGDFNFDEWNKEVKP